MDINSARKEYRTVGFTMFIIAIGLLVMRIVSYYLQVAFVNSVMEQYKLELLINVLFSVPVQIGLLLVFPFLMYKLRLKKSMRDVFAFSGYRKCNIFICLLSVVMGVLVIIVSLYFSTIWQFIIVLFGYVPQSGESAMPEDFSAAYFIITIVITAVLPGICEEFTNRGGLLTVLRMSNSKAKTVVLVGVAFGLFHQNITQVFYTAMLGALLAYLVLETGSVIPAIIIHFMNNFMSVYLDSASTYGWKLGGNFFNFVEEIVSNTNNILVATSIVAIVFIAIFLLLLAIRAISRKNKKKDFYLELNEDFKKTGIELTITDHAFYIGAIVVTALSTFITYLFGLPL